MLERRIHRAGIESASYDRRMKYLDITFQSKQIMRFFNVSEATADHFLHASEPGSYFRDNIQDEYRSEPITQAEHEKANARPKSGIPAELLKLFDNR